MEREEGDGGLTQKAAVMTEAEEQRTLFEWINRASGKYPELQLCFHIANGGSRNKIEAHNLKLQGVKPGVPDLMLPVPRGGYHGLFIELKRTKGGRASEEQQVWIRSLNRLGYKAMICHGWVEAAEAIKEYLGEKGDEAR